MVSHFIVIIVPYTASNLLKNVIILFSVFFDRKSTFSYTKRIEKFFDPTLIKKTNVYFHQLVSEEFPFAATWLEIE